MKKVVIPAALLFLLGLANIALAAETTVKLRSTAADSPLSGEVRLIETDNGLKVSARFEGVPPGKHGFHIHEKGDCSDAGQAAGGHFNPDGSPHGELAQHGFAGAHAGDLGNVEIAADGKGTRELEAPELNLREGKYNVSGRAIILHDKEDDFGQPTGNSGGRIACGVIGPLPSE